MTARRMTVDFKINKKDFGKVLREILQGRDKESGDLVDMTAERELLKVVVTGRRAEVPIEAMERGSFSIPIGVLFKMKRISGTYNDERFRIRIAAGKFRLQGMSVTHDGIKERPIARRVIDIPEEAIPRDLLALPFIFSLDEIEDCGLHGKVLDAQKQMASDLDHAYDCLRPYGISRDEISAMAKKKIQEHAIAMRHVLFSGN